MTSKLSLNEAVEYGIENNRNLKTLKERFKWHLRKGGKLSQLGCQMFR